MVPTFFSGSDIQKADQRFRTNLINCLSGFKSVTLVGTVSSTGDTNVAIFSQVFHVGANPPLMGVLSRPHSVSRHTLENIKDTRQFTLNHITEEQCVKAHHTSARWDQSEFEAVGLEEEYSEKHKAPYVKGSPIQIGLELKETQTLSINNTVLIIGEVSEIRLNDDLVGEDGFIDIEKAGTITCSGLDSYHKTSKIARLSYAKPDKVPEPI